ncbi:ABC transporter ATP-binding protein [Caproiciproducens sp. NJN-50]|uniref:ABC transporter ATP-binding protein n=1 Tax=Caproiciproducens sp. NJN-50 TaxID=2507162 RepID=UPI000FFE2ECC|nr:ABC transporter ATP-binding protein [Caproiciproducens sp. NJN-50]QAT48840.1 ABC transporter ATP-binding protein [Caproiciproducens sp. NJN-50]
MAEIKSSSTMPTLGRRPGGGARRFAPKEKAKNAKGVLKRLLRLMLRFRKSLVIAMLLTIATSSIAVVGPLLIGNAINTFDTKTASVNSRLLFVILVSLVSCYLAGWVIDTVNGVLMTRLTQRFIKDLRRQFFAKLQKLPLNFYDTRPHGDTMSRITNDVDNVSSTISQATTQLIASVFTICGTFVMMLVLSPLLTAVAMVAIPLFTLLSKTIAGRSRRYFLAQQRELGTLNAMIEESVVGLKMVKAFNRQETVLSEFQTVNGRLRDDSAKAQTWAGFMMPFMNVINNLNFALIAGVGGVLTIKGMATVGLVVSFLTYSKQFGTPLNNLAGMFNNIQSALAGAERVFEIIDETEEPPDQETAKNLENVRGAVEFQNVSFSYLPGKPVLKDVSFSIQPGEVVALVGETGAGKTTVVNLLTRFYELDSGRILIDGNDIAGVARGSLHDCFSVVLQDTCLFTGTIFDNIRYSKPAAADEEVVRAAKLAHADEFITRLPQGYQTAVTGSADNLSLGQRQLIAIARAVLCGAPILILDEATSSVDTKTEKEIQKALLTLMRNRTSFLIAHRLSTIRDADRIMVIDHGKILEMGNHSELMRRRGLYYDMVISQLG